MGCGSSGHVPQDPELEPEQHNLETEADNKRDVLLGAHIYAILCIKPISADVTKYVARLRAEGCDTPDDFDDLTVEELSNEPFSFKRLHLKKVSAHLYLARPHHPYLSGRVSNTNLCTLNTHDASPPAAL